MWRRRQCSVEYPMLGVRRARIGAPRLKLTGGTDGISGRRHCTAPVRRRPPDEGGEDGDLRRERVGHLRLGSQQRVPQSFRGGDAAERGGESRTAEKQPRREPLGSAHIVAAELRVARATADARESEIARHFQRSRDAFERAFTDREFLSAVAAVAKIIADAQHIAAEFLSRYLLDRQPLPAIALTTDTSVLTAVGNDYGFERVFERQVRGLGRRGDVFLAISTSGRSANVLAALRAAREIGLVTVGFTGSGTNEMRGHCDQMLCAPSAETAVVQQIHIIAAHAICGVVERELFGGPGA